MKKSVLSFLALALLLIISCSSSRTEEGCENLKKGKFRFHPKETPQDFYFSIQRNDSIQTESDNRSGQSAKFAITWTGKCKYELLLLETTYPYSDSQIVISKTVPIKTEILSTARDYYVFRTTRDKSSFVLVDTMWVDK